MEIRYAMLEAVGRRKITRDDPLDVILVIIDELAYFTVTIGTETQQQEVRTLVRDLVARGRAAGIIIVGATQRPSADIIPTSLRDLFGFRMAFRCTTDSSSDIILAQGWAAQGYAAAPLTPRDSARPGSSPKAASLAACAAHFGPRAHPGAGQPRQTSPPGI